MSTLFKLIPKDNTNDIDVVLFQQSLPKTFKVSLRTDGLYLDVATLREEDVAAQYLVDREMDRLFFLTRIQLKASMCTKIIETSVRIVWGDQGVLSASIAPQKWSYELALQMRLWALAGELVDPLAKIVLLFQIIELSYPSRKYYPAYIDAQVPPDEKTECKLLRHLVVHAGDVTSSELKNYCEYLGLPPLMLDRTDPQYVKVLSNKVRLVEHTARSIIEKAL